MNIHLLSTNGVELHMETPLNESLAKEICIVRETEQVWQSMSSLFTDANYGAALCHKTFLRSKHFICIGMGKVGSSPSGNETCSKGPRLDQRWSGQ